MDPIHIHLMLNHFPILGTLFGLSLLIYGMIAKNRSIENAALVTLVVIAVLTIPVFKSGEEAEHAVEEIAGVSEHYLEEHEELAERGMWLMMATGVLALISLVLPSAKEKLKKGVGIATLILAAATFIVMVDIGNHGGKIRHSELIDGAQQQSIEHDHDDEHYIHDND